MTTITKERIELFIKNPLENGLTRGEQMELARIALASLGAEPVSQTYNLPELIEGMEVSIDVSTCDADLGNRYFGTVTEASELDTAKNGYILLVQDAEPNFDINGNSPVTPDGWVIVPKKLTAENGAKGVLSGEFSETTFISCPECFGDDDCETCDGSGRIEIGFAPIFPDICYHLIHYKPAAADIPVASDNPAHYADAIRYNARTPLQGSLLPLTRLVWA